MTRIVIDRSLCSGFSSCADLAPHLFQIDQEGIASLRVGTSDDPKAAYDAADSCPMGAITVIEEAAA